MADNIAISPPITLPPHEMQCVYAVSGAYGTLPRYLYYVTLVFAIFGRTREWLVIGALVSALTYAGTAAIHAMALVGSKARVFDLDIYGAWAILSTGSMAYVVMVHWSSTLKSSRARIVMVTWGILVGTALMFGRVELFDTPLAPGEPPCYSSAGKLLQYPIELGDLRFNCTYKCFALTSPMRQWNEVMAVPRRTVQNKYSRLGLVTVGPIMFAAYASISLDSREHTPSQLCTRIVMKHLAPDRREDILKHIYNASAESWYGGYFTLWYWVHRQRWTVRKVLVCCLTVPWFTLELLVDLLCLPLMTINVVLNELVLLGSDLPTNEAAYAIGQWGPVVSSALVVIAAIINKYLEEKEKRKANTVDIPRERNEDDASTVVGSADIEVGKMDEHDPEQTCGVVVPKLAHVETLRDVGDEMWMKPRR